MWDICTAYCIAIRTLIKCSADQDRAQKAMDAVIAFAGQLGQDQDLGKFLNKASQMKHRISMTKETDEDDLFNLDVYDPQPQMGYVKHAVILAFYCLMCADSKPVDKVYDWAVQQAIMLGGDTDTNAAIVGGLIGAYAGIDNIDRTKIQKVLECRNIRPDFIKPAKGCIDDMLKLVEIAPSKLEVVKKYVD